MEQTLLLNNFWQGIFEWLNKWDTILFLKINTVWTNHFFDDIYPWFREANTWTPLYLFLLVFVIMNFKEKAAAWILFAAITLTLTDQLSSNLIKNLVARPRPCNEPYLMGEAKLLLNHCSGGFSFTSSHATNHFGFAMYIMLTLQPIFKKWRKLFFWWAAAISYGQVYVGVHYPLDILCGGLLGSLVGYLTSNLYLKYFGNFEMTTHKND